MLYFKKIYKISYFPTAVLFCISETAWAPHSHPVLSPSISRARLDIHSAACILCGWRVFQRVIYIIYVPAAEHHCIPACPAQLARLSMEEVGEVNSVSNPALTSA